MGFSVSPTAMSAAQLDRTSPRTIDDEYACTTTPRVCRGTILERMPYRNDCTHAVWCSNAFVYEHAGSICRRRLYCKWCT